MNSTKIIFLIFICIHIQTISSNTCDKLKNIFQNIKVDSSKITGNCKKTLEKINTNYILAAATATYLIGSTITMFMLHKRTKQLAYRVQTLNDKQRQEIKEIADRSAVGCMLYFELIKEIKNPSLSTSQDLLEENLEENSKTFIEPQWANQSTVINFGLQIEDLYQQISELKNNKELLQNSTNSTMR